MRYGDAQRASALLRVWPGLSLALVCAGGALRIWQYSGRSALWSDEATLANNIVGRSYSQLLLQPLAFSQAAPPGFLFVQKSIVQVFGPTEGSLRLVPYVCSIIALMLLVRVAARLLPHEVLPLVIAPFALAPPLIFFGTEAKQYSSDLAIALALLLVSVELEREEITARRASIAAAAGAAAVWFSQTAVLMVAGLGAALLVDALTSGRRAHRARIVSIVAAWAASAAGATLISLQRLAPESRAYMHQFWQSGFWPLSLQHPSTLYWPLERVATLLGGELAIPSAVASIATALAFAGVWHLWRTDRRVAMLLVAPLVVTFGASVARLYPFEERLALFLIPSLLLLVGAGVEGIASLKGDVRLARGVVGMAVLAMLAMNIRALSISMPVYRREEITPAVEYLRSASSIHDYLYVYYGVAPAYTFYLSVTSPPAIPILGKCHRDDPRGYLRELDLLRSERTVWLLISHERARHGERELMLRYLDTIGTARGSIVTNGHDVNGNVTRAYLYRYDLSDPQKLRTATADNFPLPPPPPFDPKFTCAPGSD